MDTPSPHRIAHYRLLRLLGRGASGEVWLAENVNTSTTVALKRLREDRDATPEFQRRLMVEARNLAALDHPHIVDVKDLFFEGGQAYLVMEFVEGDSLASLLREGPLDVERTERLARQVASALDHAHRHGVLHRDIKPSNLMIDLSGDTVVIDFGISISAGATRITEAVRPIGTLPYMSPQQLYGDDADERSELWSLGVVLWECLVGRHPFDGDSREQVQHRVLYAPVPELPSTVIAPDAPLRRVIESCLERRLDARLDRAGDVVALLDGRPTSSPLGEPAARNGKRGAILGAFAGCLLLLAVVLGLGLPPRNGEELVIALGDFESVDGAEDLTAFETLVHMHLGDGGTRYRVLDPAWCEDVAGRLRAQSPTGATPSLLAVARAAGATRLVLGNVATEAGWPVARVRMLDVDSGGVILRADAVTGVSLQDLAWQVSSTLRASIRDRRAASGEGSEPATPEDAAWAYYRRAVEAGEPGRPGSKERLESLRLSVEADSTFALAAYEYAMAANAETPDPLAREFAELAWRHRDRLDPKRRLLLEARRHEFDREIPPATDALRQAYARWPEDRMVVSRLLSHLNFWVHIREARSVAARALEYFPDDEEILSLAVFWDFYAGDLDLARERLEKVDRLVTARRGATSRERLDPLLLRLRVEMQRRDRAAIAASKAQILTLDGIGPVRALVTAVDAFEAGHCDAAMATLDSVVQATAETPDFDEAYGHPHGFLFYPERLAAMGRLRDARKALDALEESPDFRGFVTPIRSRILLTSGDPELIADDIATDALDTWWNRRAQFSNPQALRILLAVHREIARGNVDRAREELGIVEESVRSGASHPNMRHDIELARVALMVHEGDFDEALTALRVLDQEGRFRMIHADDVLFRRLEIRALHGAGRSEEALERLAALDEVTGHQVVVDLERARILRDLGRTDEAASSYTSFLEAWTDADRDHPRLVEAVTELEEIQHGR